MVTRPSARLVHLIIVLLMLASLTGVVRDRGDTPKVGVVLGYGWRVEGEGGWWVCVHLEVGWLGGCMCGWWRVHVCGMNGGWWVFMFCTCNTSSGGGV